MILSDIKNMAESQLNSDINGAFRMPVFQSAIEHASLTVVNEYCGIEVTPNQGPYWQKTQQVSDALTPLIKCCGENGVPFLKVNSKGFADIPDDYYILSTIALPIFTDDTCDMKVSEKEIELLTDEHFQARVMSERKRPSLKKPIATFRSGKIRVAPIGAGYLKMVYLKRPATPFFDYVFVNDVETYLPPGAIHDGSGPLASGQLSRSVEPEFGEKAKFTFYNHVYAFMSGALFSQENIRRSEQVKFQGK